MFPNVEFMFPKAGFMFPKAEFMFPKVGFMFSNHANATKTVPGTNLERSGTGGPSQVRSRPFQVRSRYVNRSTSLNVTISKGTWILQIPRNETWFPKVAFTFPVEFMFPNVEFMFPKAELMFPNVEFMFPKLGSMFSNHENATQTVPGRNLERPGTGGPFQVRSRYVNRSTSLNVTISKGT